MPNYPPNMGDFIAYGLPLRDALRLERRIAAEPKTPAAYWWRELERLMAPTASTTH